VWAQVGQEHCWVAIAGTLDELEDKPSVVSPCSEQVSWAGLIRWLGQ